MHDERSHDRLPAPEGDPFVTGRLPEGIDPNSVDPDRLDDTGAWLPTDLDPPSVPAPRRSRGVGAAMLVGIGRALQQIYDEPPPEPGAIVFEVDDDEPDRSGPIWIEFDPDDPARTIVHVAPDP